METWFASNVLGWPVYLLGWLFIVYGFLGVVIETVYCLVREGVLESRCGLLFLPLRPMYGVGGVACTVLLDRYQPQPVVVLLGGLLICTAIEYVAGTICDKVFGTLAWDYRGRVLHVQGKVCLLYSCYWAVLAALTVYVLSPLISSSIRRIDPVAGTALLTALIGLALASSALTIAAWVRTRHRLDALQAYAGGMPVPVQTSRAGRLVDRLVPDLVMINTFPRTRLTRELATVTGHQRALIRPGSRRPLASRL